MKTTVDVIVKKLLTPKRIDQFLADALEGKVSREEVKRAIQQAAILLNGEPAKPRAMVKISDRIHGVVESEVRGAAPLGEDIPISVLYEDDWLLVVEKPVGLVVHPGAGNRTGTLVNALVARGGKLSSAGDAARPGIVHRLDKETSGVLLVAKNNEAHRKLQQQFSTRSLSKTYLALVKGRVEYEEGRIEASLGRDEKIPQKMAVSHKADAREAETRYRTLKRFRYTTLLEVKLITGRTHQIRVHMQHLGHPVVGDSVYGTKTDAKYPRMALHAWKIEFVHPKTGKVMQFESPVPKEMKEMIDRAEKE